MLMKASKVRFQGALSRRTKMSRPTIRSVTTLIDFQMLSDVLLFAVKMPTLLEALEEKYGLGGQRDKLDEALVSIFVPKLPPRLR